MLKAVSACFRIVEVIHSRDVSIPQVDSARKGFDRLTARDVENIISCKGSDHYRQGCDSYLVSCMFIDSTTRKLSLRE